MKLADGMSSSYDLNPRSGFWRKMPGAKLMDGDITRGCRRSVGLALLRRGRLRLLALGDFLRAELRDAFDQLHGYALREREADRAPADLVRCKVVLERRDNLIGGGVERVVLPLPSEIEHRATLQFIGEDLVRDHFLGAGHSLPNGDSHSLE
jgi:hypothetical protein